MRTREELYRYYSGKGPNRMVLEFLEDRSLQLTAILVCTLTGPIEAQYADDLEKLSQAEDCARHQGVWAGNRAWGKRHWLQAACDILGRAQGDELPRRLRLTRAAAERCQSTRGCSRK